MISSSFSIGQHQISIDAPTYFIADIAANHDGDLERAKDLIYLAKEAGADAAKFQHFRAATIVSDEGFKALGSQQSHQAKWSKSVYEVYQDAEVPWEWTQVLHDTCKEAGIDFFTSPYDLDVIDEIDPYVPAYKIGSGDITWLENIKAMASKKKPILLACGASTMADVTRAVDAILPLNSEIALMQCNTNYTGSLENFKYIQLNVLRTFAQQFPGMILGLSDHTPGHATVLGAVALGARVIEKHFTDDNHREGPDHPFSMTPTTWRDMVDRSRELEAALGNGIKNIEENEEETAVLQRRCIRTTATLPKGHTITPDDLICLRPAPKDALPPYELNGLIGKILQVELGKGEAITKEHIHA